MTETATTSVAPPEAATCLDCGYALRGLASRSCPECGRAFDPGVRSSMRMPPEPGELREFERRLLQPVPWRHGAVRTTLIVFAVVSSWVPAPSPLPVLAVALLWLTVAFPYFLRRASRRVVVVRHGLPAELLRVDDAGVWRMRRMFLVAFVVAASHVPFFVNFAISSPFLRRSARHWLTEAPSTANPPRTARVHGLFLVTSTEATMREVRFWTPGGVIVYRLNDRGDDVERVGMADWSRFW
jgi:hypothetical protein